MRFEGLGGRCGQAAVEEVKGISGFVTRIVEELLTRMEVKGLWNNKN